MRGCQVQVGFSRPRRKIPDGQKHEVDWSAQKNQPIFGKLNRGKVE